MAKNKSAAQQDELASAPILSNEISSSNVIFAGGKGYINTQTSNPPIAPLEGVNGFLIIFKNKKQEVIAAFSSQQDKKLDVKLKYERAGGLTSGTIRMQYGNFPYYNDMLVEIRMGLASLGHMYIESFALKDNMLDFTLYSAMRRFNDKTYSGNAANMKLKDAFVYFLKMIKDDLDAAEPEFFRINADKILPRGNNASLNTVFSSIFFIDKTAKEIFNGFAVLLGNASYGIDADYDFYLDYAASAENKNSGLDFVGWEDFHVFNLQYKTDDSVISNQCNLYSKRQGSSSASDKEELILLAIGDNIASQEIYGKKAINVNLPFYLNSTVSLTRIASNCLTPQPAINATFNIYNPNFTMPPIGFYQLAMQAKDDERVIFCLPKSSEQFVIWMYQDFNRGDNFWVSASSLWLEWITTGFFTGKQAFLKLSPSADDIITPLIGFTYDYNFSKRSSPVIAKKIVIAMQSNRELNFYAGHNTPNGPVRPPDDTSYSFKTVIPPNPIMGFVEIELDGPTAISGVSIGPYDKDNPFIIDSIYYIPAMTHTIQGLYDGHTLDINEREVKMTISLGHDNNDFVEQFSELAENAKLADQLAKQAIT